MKSKSLGIVAIAAAFTMLPLSSASALSIAFDDSNPTGYTGTLLFDFEELGPPPVELSGSFSLETGNAPGVYVEPNNDSTQYLVTPVALATDPGPPNPINGSAFLDLTAYGPLNYFGLYWGSIDEDNEIKFYSGGLPTAGGTLTGDSILGSQVIGDTNFYGRPDRDESNRYLNITGFIAPFDAVEFIAQGRAFEIDNIAGPSNVPIPAAVWLLGSGLFGIVMIRRRK